MLCVTMAMLIGASPLDQRFDLPGRDRIERRAGSSSNNTAGLTATARAMQRRCCWPPDSAQARLVCNLSLTSSQRPPCAAPARRDLRFFADFNPSRRGGYRRRCCRRSTWGTASTAERPCRRASAATSGPPLARDVPAIEVRLAGPRVPGKSSCMRFRARSSVDLPQPEGPMKAVTRRVVELEVDALRALRNSVVEAQILDHDLGLRHAAFGGAVDETMARCRAAGERNLGLGCPRTRIDCSSAG